MKDYRMVNQTTGKGKLFEFKNRRDVGLRDALHTNTALEELYAKRPELALTKEENREQLLFGITLANLPQIDINNNEQVKSRIEEYFNLNYTEGKRSTLSGLALALGLSRNQLTSRLNGETKTTKEVFELLQTAVNVLNNEWESLMISNKVLPANAIFLGKNNFGYVDELKTTVLKSNTDISNDKENLKEKYLKNIVDVKFVEK